MTTFNRRHNRFFKRALPANAKPWLNKDGSLKSDDEIKELGQKWGQETWSNYLDATLGNLRYDRLAFFPNMDTDAVASRPQLVDFMAEREHYSRMKAGLQKAIESLSDMEKSLIDDLFWGEKSCAKIAREMKVSPSKVRVWKFRALKKLREILPSRELRRKLHGMAKEEFQNKEERDLLSLAYRGVHLYWDPPKGYRHLLPKEIKSLFE